MPEPTLEAKPLTRADIGKMSADEFRKAMKDPEKAAQISAALASVDTSQLEAALEEENEQAKAIREAQEAESARVAAEAQAAEQREASAFVAQKEQERLAEEARKAEEARVAATPQKIVIEYQAKDENGQPIGSPTHLEAYSPEEMYKKMQNAHENATRAFHRLKKQKLTQKQPELPSAKLTDEQLIDLNKKIQSDDQTIRFNALRQLADHATEVERDKLRVANAEADRTVETFKFLTNHVNDYYRCEANGKILSNYLNENDLAWTADNLEIAFLAVENKLAQAPGKPAEVPAPAAVVPPVVKPAAEVPVAANTAAVPVVPSAVAEPTPTPAPQSTTVPNTPPTPRPGVNGAFVPGATFTGARQETKPAGLTKADIKAWTAEEMRKQMRNPAMRAEIDRVLAGK